jgi:membrane protease YdiL (CAAX protease family)
MPRERPGSTLRGVPPRIPLSTVALTAARHPVRSYVLLAFGISWVCWSVPASGSREGIGSVFLLLGGFGPLIAALIMVRVAGGSPGQWFKGLFRWRVAPRWYAFAVGVPLALTALITAEFALAGRALDWSILDDRLALFLPSLVFVALAGGGNEEPGWRGFALPRLQERSTPVRATLLLGAVWALWHLPLLFTTDEASHGLGAGGLLVLAALTLLSVVGYAFAYTYLLNRSGSVLLCILLHAAFNTAMASAGLRAEAALQRWEYILTLGLGTATIWVGVALLIRLTRGQLGADASTIPRRPSAIAVAIDAGPLSRRPIPVR